jgi:hypothetical protein
MMQKAKIARKANGNIRRANHAKQGEGVGEERPDSRRCGKEQSRLVKASKTLGLRRASCVYKRRQLGQRVTFGRGGELRIGGTRKNQWAGLGESLEVTRGVGFTATGRRGGQWVNKGQGKGVPGVCRRKEYGKRELLWRGLPGEKRQRPGGDEGEEEEEMKRWRGGFEERRGEEVEILRRGVEGGGWRTGGRTRRGGTFS